MKNIHFIGPDVTPLIYNYVLHNVNISYLNVQLRRRRNIYYMISLNVKVKLGCAKKKKPIFIFFIQVQRHFLFLIKGDNHYKSNFFLGKNLNIFEHFFSRKNISDFVFDFHPKNIFCRYFKDF